MRSAVCRNSPKNILDRSCTDWTRKCNYFSWLVRILPHSCLPICSNIVYCTILIHIELISKFTWPINKGILILISCLSLHSSITMYIRINLLLVRYCGQSFFLLHNLLLKSHRLYQEGVWLFYRTLNSLRLCNLLFSYLRFALLYFNFLLLVIIHSCSVINILQFYLRLFKAFKSLRQTV